MKMLVIDDNVAQGETLAMMLEALGHTPYVALSGYAGIDAARSVHPKLILLDLGLPDIDGCDVCRGLRELPGLKGAVIVIMSGQDDPVDIERARFAGCDHYIVKPVPFDALTRLLASIEDVEAL